jgi:hypothetical protein
LALRRRPCGGWRQTAPMLRWLKTVVASVRGKGAALIASGGDQEDVPEAFGLRVERALLRRRKGLDGIEIGGPASSSEMSLVGARGCWPGGVRRGGGVSLVCGSCTEREKASVESGRPGLRVSTAGGERERANGRNRRH